MRHSLQTVVAVRLAFGRSEHGKYLGVVDESQPAILSAVMAEDTPGRFAQRLTTHSLAELRRDSQVARRLGFTLQASLETRKGRRAFRKARHKAKE